MAVFVFFMRIQSIEKRTGKFMFTEREYTSNQQFYALLTNAREGTIDLINYEMKFRFYLDTGGTKGKAEKDKGPAGSGGPPPGTGPGSAPPPPKVIRDRIRSK